MKVHATARPRRWSRPPTMAIAAVIGSGVLLMAGSASAMLGPSTPDAEAVSDLAALPATDLAALPVPDGGLPPLPVPVPATPELPSADDLAALPVPDGGLPPLPVPVPATPMLPSADDLAALPIPDGGLPPIALPPAPAIPEAPDLPDGALGDVDGAEIGDVTVAPDADVNAGDADVVDIDAPHAVDAADAADVTVSEVAFGDVDVNASGGAASDGGGSGGGGGGGNGSHGNEGSNGTGSPGSDSTRVVSPGTGVPSSSLTGPGATDAVTNSALGGSSLPVAGADQAAPMAAAGSGLIALGTVLQLVRRRFAC